MDTNILDTYRKKISAITSPQTPQQWKTFNKLQPLASLLATLDILDNRQAQADQIMSSEQDTQLLELARQEISDISQQRNALLSRIQEEIAKLEHVDDDRDERNAVFEIRAGAGGEEAALFAADLFRMYSLYAAQKGFSVEVLNQHLSETGGFKEITASVSGEGAFGLFKWESGVHRVQRIPATESSGRIHTSTASVAVMPEAEDIDIEIKPEDMRIDTYRSSGAGGQHVNKTDSAIRITHLPTGIIVSCQESRSQLKNRQTALSLLRTRLYDRQLEEQQQERAALRKEHIKTAQRAEKVRTYNFPQNRITDHRLKKSWHNLTTVLHGDLDELLSDMKALNTHSAHQPAS